MRIPFPPRIPLGPFVAVLTLELCIQLIQGTDPVFAGLMLISQVCAIAAFNFWAECPHERGILPLRDSTNRDYSRGHPPFSWQPGDLNLVHPIKTAGVCAVFFACVMLAARMVSSMRHPPRCLIA